MSETELIQFVDDRGNSTGKTGPKLASHTADTQLHLAFSCYIFRKSDGKLLVTQRALSKKVWPGVWTNSVCGHVSPNESIESAVRRRADYELGYKHLDNVRLLVSDYTYRTPPFNGIIEHEFCPIFCAEVNDDPILNPDEVEAYEWLDLARYQSFLETHDEAKVSWWAVDQYRLIADMLARQQARILST